MNLDAINYRNGTKNNWRRRAWNIVAEAVPNRRDALVLYLPGAANLDLRVALERGFRRSNMVCVERDKRVARYLRRQYSQPVIDERLANVMSAWPDHHPISVVVADMVCGLEREALAIICPWVAGAAFAGSTLVLNVMRGRETQDVATEMRGLCSREEWPSIAASWGVDQKHRGLLAMWAIQFLRAQLFERNRETSEVMRSEHASGEVRKRWRFSVLPGYRSSSGQYFDTLIATDLGYQSELRAPTAVACNHPSLLPEWREEFAAVRRRIAALLAVRTMRGPLN